MSVRNDIVSNNEQRVVRVFSADVKPSSPIKGRRV